MQIAPLGAYDVIHYGGCVVNFTLSLISLCNNKSVDIQLQLNPLQYTPVLKTEIMQLFLTYIVQHAVNWHQLT